ncbi:hypothetical protein DQ384_26345 [Sphaerisporangium album]|uniref:Uncharacterized protein n=1 Tax=Sphaerisporangium album TaxID=509200 RepID=A0A367FAF0_9ACTN|nr:hypothetical protein [Sphaerisporangium album]RCG27241.1 hypothetical protein DQ384_26345 [Sphaerisporangium album]
MQQKAIGYIAVALWALVPLDTLVIVTGIVDPDQWNATLRAIAVAALGCTVVWCIGRIVTAISELAENQRRAAEASRVVAEKIDDLTKSLADISLRASYLRGRLDALTPDAIDNPLEFVPRI